MGSGFSSSKPTKRGLTLFWFNRRRTSRYAFDRVGRLVRRPLVSAGQSKSIGDGTPNGRPSTKQFDGLSLCRPLGVPPPGVGAGQSDAMETAHQTAEQCSCKANGFMRANGVDSSCDASSPSFLLTRSECSVGPLGAPPPLDRCGSIL